MEKCRICNSESNFIFEGLLIENKVNYFECQNCGFVQTEEPYWLDKAYANPINVSDTGILKRCVENKKIILTLLMILGLKDSTVVDYAGGYGVLVRMLRDIGVDAYWADKYSPNLISKGFEYDEDKHDCNFLTAFEVFEHLVYPCKDIEKMFDIAPIILFSTELIDDKTPRLKDWWYYGTEHGQHIGFFKKKTLTYLATKYKKNFVSNGINYHIFYNEKKDLKILKFFKYIIKLKRFSLFFSPIFFKSKTIEDHNHLS